MSAGGWPTCAERLSAEGEIERQCRKCSDWWPLDQFEKSPSCRGGRSSTCHACRNEYRGARRRQGLGRAA